MSTIHAKQEISIYLFPAMQCYLKRKERSVAFITEKYAAIIQKPSVKDSDCIITFTCISLEEFEKIKEYELLFGGEKILGTLGLFNYVCEDMKEGVFLCVARKAKLVLRIGNRDPISKLENVSFISLDQELWDEELFEPMPRNSSPSSTFSTSTSDLNNIEKDNLVNSEYSSKYSSTTRIYPYHSLSQLTDLLTDGSFYVSTNISCFSRFQSEQPYGPKDIYCWNRFLITELDNHFSEAHILEKFPNLLLHCFRGYVERMFIDSMSMSIISKVSSYGSRQTYPPSGIDDSSYCSMFVETEFIVEIAQTVFSFVQVRGTVPCFWEEQFSSWYGPSISFLRSSQASQSLFNFHFSKLYKAYGDIYVIDLLQTKGFEASLYEAYKHHLMLLPFPAVVKKFHFTPDPARPDIDPRLETDLADDLKEMGYTQKSIENDMLESFQKGVFRINDLDCLGRTNVIQYQISRLVLKDIFFNLQIGVTFNILEYLRHLWSNNGDAIAKLITGVGSIGSSATRRGRKSIAGSLSDISKSFGRMYVGRYPDVESQNAILLLLGCFPNQSPVLISESVSSYIQGVLRQRRSEYRVERDFSIFSSTFNANGKVPSTDEFKRLLLPFGERTSAYDLYVVAVQEIITLNMSHLVSSSNQKLRIWEEKILMILNSRDSNNKYMLISSIQMAGVFLGVFIRKDDHLVVSKVTKTTRKTGFGGFSANKGAVAIEMNVCDSDFCFVSSHFAPKVNNISERNMEYTSISDNLVFPSGMKIYDHTYVTISI